MATFSHDPTGREHRLDRFMGVEQGQFFLSHGGFAEGFTLTERGLSDLVAANHPHGPEAHP